MIAKIATTSLVLLLLGAAQAGGGNPKISGEIRLREKLSDEKISKNVQVTCVDVDPGYHNDNDHIAQGGTGRSSSFELSYDDKQWDSPSVFEGADPEIMCKFRSDDIFPFQSGIYGNWDQDKDLVISNSGSDYLAMYPDRRDRCRSVGCFTLIDSIFEDACHNHDCCYKKCAENGETQESCDDEFYALMLSEARDHCDNLLCLGATYAAAYVFYTAAWKLGGPAWDSYCEDRRLEESNRHLLDERGEPLAERFPADDGFHETEETSDGNNTVLIAGVVVGVSVVVVGAVMYYARRRQSKKNESANHAHASGVLVDFA